MAASFMLEIFINLRYTESEQTGFDVKTGTSPYGNCIPLFSCRAVPSTGAAYVQIEKLKEGAFK